jgi:hypothetical protein
VKALLAVIMLVVVAWLSVHYGARNRTHAGSEADVIKW